MERLNCTCLVFVASSLTYFFTVPNNSLHKSANLQNPGRSINLTKLSVIRRLLKPKLVSVNSRLINKIYYMLNLKNQVCSELSHILFLVSDNSLQRPANSRLLTEVPVVQLKVETINFMKLSVSQISTVHFLHHYYDLLTTKSVLIVITAIGNLLHC